ncbi:hypothetical protein L0128_01635 [candidate division KSB1 bacterium]|nr:hypothetical protein [candidate division KSB1 bacterium]
MKATLRLVAVICLVAMTVGYAQAPADEKFINKAHANYLMALNSTNDGLRNNAIFMVLKFKMRYPTQDIRDIMTRLEQISQKDPISLNRVHACLAKTYLENPSLAVSVNPCNFVEPRQFYDRLHELMTAQELAIKYVKIRAIE